MASLFDKANTRLPGLLRPFSRLKTKLAGVKPVTAAKHFALWVVKLATVKKLKIGQRADRFASEAQLPHTVMRSQLGMMVDTELHSRKIAEAEKVEGRFKSLGLKHGTKATKEEAQAMMANLTVLHKALGEYVTQVDEHISVQEKALADVQTEFETEVVNLKKQAWSEFQDFLEGKSAAEIIDNQSVHQLVMGTSYVEVEGGGRLPGLRAVIKDIQNGIDGYEKDAGETDFEAGLRLMKNKWSEHRDEIDEKIIGWEKDMDTTDARKYQHYIAALVSIDRLAAMIDEPNKDAAREARQKFLGTYGEMFGVEGRNDITQKHFQRISEIATSRREKDASKLREVSEDTETKKTK